MRNTSILLFSAFLSFFNLSAVQAQYWQQDASYQIDVSLDTLSHQLKGNLVLLYTNHSPNSMDSLYFHLWPNAYSSKSSAFARQQIKNGSLDFRFSKEEDMGKMWGLDFKVEETPVELSYKTASKEIGAIKLPEVLQPGETVTVQTPFEVSIPKVLTIMPHS